LKFDFHTHTKYSRDSRTEPKDLAKKAKELRIIPAITDHNSTKAHYEFRNLGIRFIPGEEIGTDSGDLIGLYLNEEIPKKTPFLEALDRIHEQGGLAYLPHMFDLTRYGMNDPKLARKVDIIEIFNARSVMQDFNKKADDFAKRNNIPGAAGSDSHFLFEFGSTYTELPEIDLDNPKDLLKSLRKSRVFGKPAPIYVKGTTTLVKLWKKLKEI
jgi:predicted metal-dependent phosphoesterase TrpH